MDTKNNYYMKILVACAAYFLWATPGFSTKGSETEAKSGGLNTGQATRPPPLPPRPRQMVLIQPHPPAIPPRPSQSISSNPTVGHCVNNASNLTTVCSTNSQVIDVSSKVAKSENPLEAVKEAFQAKGQTSSPLIVQFKNHSFPLHYRLKNNNELVFKIKQSQPSSGTCLEFIVNLEKRTGELDDLATGSQCPLPESGQGNYVLDFVDAMSNTLLLSETTLQDASVFSCDKNFKSTPLTFLRTMQKGQGWYESRGYQPRNYEEYKNNYERIRNYNLNDIVGTLKHSEHSKLAPLLSEFKSAQPSSNTLSTFMSWLWNKDCAQYIEIQEFLFPASNPMQFPWAQLLPKDSDNLSKKFRAECSDLSIH